MEPEVQQQNDARVERTPRRRNDDHGIRALAKFVKALETQNANSQRAAILWLADRFLGMKPRDWFR